jgi:hypothetical protein
MGEGEKAVKVLPFSQSEPFHFSSPNTKKSYYVPLATSAGCELEVPPRWCCMLVFAHG